MNTVLQELKSSAEIKMQQIERKCQRRVELLQQQLKGAEDQIVLVKDTHGVQMETMLMKVFVLFCFFFFFLIKLQK